MNEKKRLDEVSNGKLLVTVCRFVIHLAIHKMIGIVVYQVIRAASSGETLDLFNYHIIFSTIGYQLLMIEAIMSFNKESSWIKNLPRKTVRLVHLVLGSLGGISSFSGAVIMMVNSGGQFRTSHSVCALIAFIFSIITIFNGTLTYFSPQLRDKLKPATIKAIHTTCGMISIIMGLVALCLGINKNILSDLVGLVSTLTTFIILILIYALFLLIESRF